MFQTRGVMSSQKVRTALPSAENAMPQNLEGVAAWLAGMFQGRAKGLPGSGIPEPHCAVIDCRWHQAAVRAEGDGV